MNIQPRLFPALLLALAPALCGGIYIEMPPPGTGQLPAAAAVIPDFLATTDIVGDLLDGRGGYPANVADLYAFDLPLPAYFTAYTLGGPGLLADPQLFLFDAAGRGLRWNNDASLTPSNTQADLGPAAFYEAGRYYLGISFYAVDPVSASGLIFNTLGSNQGGPSGPGGADPLAGWENAFPSTIWDTSTYLIHLQVQAVPEPGTALSLGAALFALFCAAARRRRRA